MKKLLSIILLCSLGISQDELKHTMDDFVGKWNLVSYISEGEKLPFLRSLEEIFLPARVVKITESELQLYLTDWKKWNITVVWEKEK